MNQYATLTDSVRLWLDPARTLRTKPWLNATAAFAYGAGTESANAPAASVVSGKFGKKSMHDGDTALATATTGNDLDAITKVLIDHPITGATTVLGLARTATGYNPQFPATDGNAAAFNKYVTKVLDAPFFHLTYSDTKSLHQASSDWDKLIGDIVELFEGVIDENRTRVVSGLKALAHSATATNKKEQTMNVFCQQVVSVGESGVTVGIYSSEVAMLEATGKHTTRQADFKVSRALLSFQTNTWPQFARMVAAKQITSVTQWLADTSTLPRK